MSPNRRLLVIDDSPDLAALLADVGTGMGWEVRSGYGDAAVTLAQTWKPQVITLDLLMPSLDGWAMRQVLRNDPRTVDIPVIILTGVPLSAREEERLHAFAVLDKPFSVSVLEHVLDAAMNI